jgi:hypothetical protein
MLNTNELRQFIEKLYVKIENQAKKDNVFTNMDDHFNSNNNNESGNYCYSDDKGYHYITYQRGIEVKRVDTNNVDEISYLTLDSDILHMAMEYARINRKDGEDWRRLLFKKELEYWSIIGEPYYSIAEKKVEKIIKESPFVDQKYDF